MRKKKPIQGVDYSKGLKSDDLPATQGLVDATRLELSAKITTLELTMRSEFEKVSSGFHKVNLELSGLHSQLGSVKSDLASVKSDLASVKSDLAAVKSEIKDELKAEFNSAFLELRAEMQKMMVSMAQMHIENTKQRNENRIVLDGISILVERQDKVERRINDLEGMPS